MYIAAPNCFCSACSALSIPSDPDLGVVTGYLSAGRWLCVYCGAPVARRSSLVSAVRLSLRLVAEWFLFECRLGRASRYPWVRWLSR